MTVMSVQDSDSRASEAAWRRLWQALPKAALGNLVAKLGIVSLGLASTVMVGRQGPGVQGAFALFVAVGGGLLTLFSGLGLWLARQMSQQVDARSARTLPMLRGVLRAAVGLGAVASLTLLALSWGCLLSTSAAAGDNARVVLGSGTERPQTKNQSRTRR